MLLLPTDLLLKILKTAERKIGISIKIIMMKKYLIPITALLSLLWFGSCSISEVENMEQNSSEMDFPDFCIVGDDVSSSDAETKVRYHNGFYWQPNDLAVVYPGTTYKATYQYTGASEAYSGTLKRVGDGGDFTFNNSILPKNYSLVPYSPSICISTLSPLTFNMILPETQNYIEGGIADNIPLMAITKDRNDKNLYFQNLCGCRYFYVRGDKTIKKIVVSAPNGEALSGVACVVDNSGVPELTMSTNEANVSNHIILDCGSGTVLSNSSGTIFYFVLPPGHYSRLDFLMVDTDGGKMLKSLTNTTIERGYITNIGDVQYEPTDIPNVNIPNALFKEYLVSKYDTDFDSEISQTEARAITSIVLEDSRYHYINSFEGVENFVNLEEFKVWYPEVTSYDLSSNSKLKHIEINYSQVSIDDLDLGEMPDLTYFKIYGSSFYSPFTIDYSDIPNLRTLYLFAIYSHEKLDLTPLKKLEFLTIDNTLNVEEIDVTGCDNLMRMSVYYDNYNNLRTISTGTLPNLERIVFSHLRSLTYLDLTQYPSLQELYLMFTGVSSLNLIQNPDIQEAHVYNNELTSLRLGNNQKLKILRANNNHLSKIDLSNCQDIESIMLYDNELSSISVAGLKKLYYLDVDGNPIGSIYLNNPDLSAFYCSDTDVRRLDFTYCPLISEVYASNNSKLSSVNFYGCSELNRVFIQNCNLRALDLRNTNDIISIVNCTGNPNLNEVVISSGQIITSYVGGDIPLVEK